jgi:hypothetical protein
MAKPKSVGSPTGPESAGSVGSAGNPGNLAGKYSTILPKDLENMRAKAEARGDTGTTQEIASEQSLRSRMSSFKKGGAISASCRADGIASRGKTRGKMI